MKVKRKITIILELSEEEALWLRKASKLPLTGNECANDYNIRMKFFKAVNMNRFREYKSD